MAKRTALASVFTALAIVLSYVDFLLPVSLFIPGIKLGLANLVTLLGIFFFDPATILLILISRILLSGFLFGNVFSILYSLSGGLLSFLVMMLFSKKCSFSIFGISIAGAVFHNTAQLVLASFLLRNTELFLSYEPVLILSGIVTGFFMALICTWIIPILQNAKSSMK